MRDEGGLVFFLLHPSSLIPHPSYESLAPRYPPPKSDMTFPLRYLVPFGPKQTPHLFTDILIIGAGIAGLRAALEVPSSRKVLVVTKDSLQQSNSSLAQGGIAGVISAGGPL